MLAPSVLFHITDRASWAAAESDGEYRPASLDQTGSVGCWPAALVEAAVAEQAGRGDLMLLRIDPAGLRPGLRIERGPERPGMVVVGGPVNLDAVFEVEDLPWDGERYQVDDEIAALAVHGGKTLAEALAQARGMMAGFDRPWWIAGGWAIDCLLGRRTRPHADLELSVLDRDQQALFAHLGGWELRLARPGGDFERWDGTPLRPPEFHQVWARSGRGQAPTPGEFVRDPSYVGFLLEASQRQTWRYRRHLMVTRPVAELGMHVQGVPVLRPEIALLYKSRGPRRRDQRDFALAVPRLDPGARAWLSGAVAAAHPDSPWRAALDAPTARGATR